MSLIERAGKAVAVELGFCDPDEWGTDECNREDRDTALRAAGAALDAANCEGAASLLTELGQCANTNDFFTDDTTVSVHVPLRLLRAARAFEGR